MIALYDFDDTITKALEKAFEIQGFNTSIEKYHSIKDMRQTDAELYIIPTKYADCFYGKPVIYLNFNPEETIKCLTKYPNNHFINVPVDPVNVGAVFDAAVAQTKLKAITTQITNHGEEIIKLKDLNYINISGRNLRFHLQNDEYIDSQCLRKSFAKETEKYLIHKNLCFIAPSLIINLTNVKTLYLDHLEFTDKEILYFPKSAYKKIEADWHEYWK